MADMKNMQKAAAEAQAVQDQRSAPASQAEQSAAPGGVATVAAAAQVAREQAAESQAVEGQEGTKAPEVHNIGAWRQVAPGSHERGHSHVRFIPENYMRANSEGTNRLHTALTEAVVSAFIFLAFAFGLQNALAQLAALPVVVVAGLVACIGALALALAGVRGATRQLAVMGVAVLLLFAVLFVPQLSSAFAQVVNAFVSSIDDLFDMFIPLSSPTAAPAGMACAVCVGLFLGLAAWLLVSLRSVVATGVLVTLVVGFGTVLGLAGTLGAYVCAAFALGLNVQYALQRGMASYRRSAWVCALVAVMVAVGGCLAALYVPASAVDTFRASTNAAVDAARYGTDTLPRGDVAAAASMNDVSSDATVELSFSELPENDLYLRGFTGATLEGTQWDDLDHTSYEGSWQGMLSWLSAHGFKSSTQYASFEELNEQAGIAVDREYSVQVSTMNARSQYAYAPPALTSLSAATDENRDDAYTSTELAGATNYSVSAYDVGNWLEAAPTWLSTTAGNSSEATEYKECEAVYRAFVNANYLGISDEDKETATRLFFSGDTWEGDDASIASVASRVQAMLVTLAAYDASPASYTGQEDFLTWFCEDERRGNSAYFATAAVLAFRSQGIPARYAEGYLLTSNTLAELAANGSTETTLGSGNAHAWVEVYRDGIGWVPVEVTPGFYQQHINASNIVQVNQESSSGDANNPSADGAVSGNVPEAEREQSAEGFSPLAVVAGVLGLVVLAAVVVVLVFELRRRGRLTRHKAALESDDQQVAVRASFDELSYMLLASGVAFDTRRAPEGYDSVATVFSEIRPEEYGRVVSLYQKAVFGGKQLAVNEARALSRFNERIAKAVPAPKSLRERLRNRYRYLR